MTRDSREHPDGKHSAILAWMAFLLPIAVIVSVWVPEFAHYYVRPEPLRTQGIEAARVAPAQSVLDEIGQYRVRNPWRTDDAPETVIAEADGLLQGKYIADDGTEVIFKWPFDPEDLDRGPGSWQLLFAAFIVPDRLLKAYIVTGEKIYLDKAVDFIKAWHAYEDTVWLPRGLFWNDHATAERVYVLVDFWRVYRASEGFDANTAEQMLSILERCAKLLAKPDHFTFATNHGVMQNLALMHVGIAVPQLPSAGEYEAVGRTRIQKQFGFFFSPEGPVLEHSAGYHSFGLALIGMFTRYMALSGQPLPPDWRQRYMKAGDFFALLLRPDGTLPLVGDTSAEAGGGPPVFADIPPDFTRSLSARTDWKPDRPFAFYPLSGYSIWWNGLQTWPNERNLSQLLVTWSHFPGHGHPRAAELSVLFWAGGQTWWTNTGYWDFGHPARSAAESWEGSGAPHAQGEAARDERSTAIKGFGQEREVRAIDLERKTEDGLRVRRQIIQASPELWLVLDQTEDRAGRPVSATWTTYPDVAVERGDRPDSFLLKSERRPATLDVSVLGAEGVTVHQRKGDTQPLAGWVFVGGRATPANALLVTHRKNLDWSAVIWSLSTDGKPAIVAAPRVTWKDAENWDATVSLASGQVKISRLGNAVQVGDVRLDLQPAPDVSAGRLAMQQAYSMLKREFPKFADVPKYRAKMTYALLIVLTMQCVVYLLVRRRFGRYAQMLLGTAIPVWMAGAVWLHAIYFRT